MARSDVTIGYSPGMHFVAAPNPVDMAPRSMSSEPVNNLDLDLDMLKTEEFLINHVLNISLEPEDSVDEEFSILRDIARGSFS